MTNKGTLSQPGALFEGIAMITLRASLQDIVSRVSEGSPGSDVLHVCEAKYVVLNYIIMYCFVAKFKQGIKKAL